MNRVIRFASILLIAGSLSTVQAQLTRTTTKVGTTVAQFLKIGAGARSVAMGGSAAAMEGDIYSIYWNPGALARLKTPGEASFNHTQWLADINHNYIATGLTVDGFGTLGLSVTSVTTPEDIVRTEINPEGDGRRWSYNAVAIGLSYARALTDQFSIGFTTKYIHEGLWNMSSSGFAFDIGTIYTTNFNGLRIGASISNFGTKMRLDGQDISFNNFPTGVEGQGPQNVQSLYKTESYDIPLQFRIGLAMDAVKFDEIRATVAVDAVHPNDNTEYMNAGAEFAYDETFFARIGVNSLLMDNTEMGMTWGVGFYVPFTAMTGVKVDYAYADAGRLKNLQYVTVGVTY